LFGRNTTGGAILLVPKKPTDRLEGYIEGSIGNYDMRRVQAVLNVPLADTFKVRLGVDRQKRDGYLRNRSGVGPKDFGDSNYLSLRASIVADLTPDLENYTLARYSRSDTHGIMFRMVACDRTASFPPPSSSVIRQAIFGPAACNQIDRQNARGDGFYDVENIVDNPFSLLDEWQVSNTTTWRASDTLTVKNIISYAEFHESGHQNIGGDRLISTAGPTAGLAFATTTIRNLPGRYLAAQNTFTEELQLQGNSGDGSFVWQAGGYYESSKPLGAGNTTISYSGLDCADVWAFQCQVSIPFVSALASLGHIENQVAFENLGFYGQGTYNITDQLAITAGIRYTIDKATGRGGRTSIRFTEPNVPIGACANPKFSSISTLNATDCWDDDFVERSKKPTWLIDLEYKPIPDLMVYAKWARGYRQGGVNPSNIGLEVWDPEKVDTYEIGAKASFNGAVRGYFNVTAFYNDFTAQQLQAIAIGKPGSGIPGARIIVNAGKSRIYGVEVDSSVSPFEGFKLDVGYAYLKTKLQEFTPPTLAADSPFAEIRPQVTGGPLPLSPKHRVSATATYTLPLDDSIGKVSFGATFTHTSSQVASDTSPFGIMPASDLLNLNFNWNSVAGSPIDLAAFVTNVTKEEFPVNTANSWGSYGFETVVTNVPRMYGLRLKYSFGD
ncbi:MAG: TonB-dependent receptor, partial [Novosphingobium sp.]|nr:TonB-dependent receptor [Novosphingobium sp.]